MENHAEVLLEIEDRLEAIKERYKGEYPDFIEVDPKVSPMDQIEQVALDNLALAYLQSMGDQVTLNFVLAQYKMTKEHLKMLKK